MRKLIYSFFKLFKYYSLLTISVVENKKLFSELFKYKFIEELNWFIIYNRFFIITKKMGWFIFWFNIFKYFIPIIPSFNIYISWIFKFSSIGIISWNGFLEKVDVSIKVYRWRYIVFIDCFSNAWINKTIN